MKVFTATQMAAFDKRCIEDLGIPGLLLMEHAGFLIAQVCQDELNSLGKGHCGRVIVLCGGGNNGGDGFVAARHLLRWGHDVDVLALKEATDYKGDAAENLRLLSSVTGCEVTLFDEEKDLDLDHYNLAIDALFGTGLSGPLRGRAKAAVEALNRASLPIVAADIPSGLSADTGVPLGKAVRAKTTVTMGLPKLGFLKVSALPYLGHLIVADIGFPQSELTAKGEGETNELIVAGEAVCWLPMRDQGAHKGNCGRVLVVGGSRGMVGAAVMAARSALRSGAGLVMLALPESIRSEAAAMAPEIMTMGLPEIDGHLSPEAVDTISDNAWSCSSVILGPGIGRSSSVSQFQSAFLERTRAPMVIDADGLFNIGQTASFSGRQVILTPHEGEAGRLCSVDSQTIRSDRQRWVRRLALQRGATVVLKGAFSECGDPSGRVYINPTGNAGMATAGSGDVLAGIVGCFFAQMNDDPLHAAALGTYVHGLAGDLIAAEKSQRSLIASDLIESLPRVFARLEDVEPADGVAYPETIAEDGLTIIR